MKRLAILVAVLALVGCGTTHTIKEPPKERPAETLMLENFDMSWLQDCELLEEAQVSGRRGDLLVEYIVVTGLLEKCDARHGALARYLRPYIDALRAKPTK